MGNILWWILVGFIAGTLAKLVLPGDKKEPKGCLLTILLGIAGSVVTGFLLSLVPGWEGSGGLLPTILGATLGAIILILIFRKFLSGPERTV